jgi:hypothetical protein
MVILHDCDDNSSDDEFYGVTEICYCGAVVPEAFGRKDTGSPVPLNIFTPIIINKNFYLFFNNYIFNQQFIPLLLRSFIKTPCHFNSLLVNSSTAIISHRQPLIIILLPNYYTWL